MNPATLITLALIAAVSTALPGLVIFDLAGSARTDFAVFTLFVLFVFSLLGSTLAGLPFHQSPHQLTMALILNVVFLLPALAGTVYGRWAKHKQRRLD